MDTNSRRRAHVLCSASALVMAVAFAPAAFAQSTPASPAATSSDSTTALGEVVVTGSTTKRTLLNASVAITAINSAELDQKAPRSTVDVLELVPGIFVEGTAGPVSNNYSVRGLPGGSQQFIRLIEDGMPVMFGNLNDDELFQYDLSIDRVEALEGGTSGILTENAAGASINFISRKLNYDQGGGLFRVTGASYGDERADLWYSAPLPLLGPNVAFAISGYIDSTHGVRSSPFTYQTYHFKGQLEKKFDGGGFVRATYKRWDEHDPYYADQPYSVTNGKPGGLPGLGTQFGNIIGTGFGSITVPDSCASNECTRTFSEQKGIHASGNEYRIDFEKPITESLGAFARVRYTQTDWDFNGVFAGSGVGNAGLASAVNYLTVTPDLAAPHNSCTPGGPTYGGAPAGAVSPIDCLLLGGQAAFPTATQFGIRSLKTGQVIAASNTAALNALNGNGLLEQTWLNRQLIKLRDWGSDFGVKWKTQGDRWTNSLTVGGMVYSQYQSNDQSGVSHLINDVTNNSNIYDVVALNSSNQVVGTLTNNGLIGYGDWGSGINHNTTTSESVYFNDEFTFADRLHIDVGLRYENEKNEGYSGNSSAAAVPAGTGGLLQINPNAFNGTFGHYSGTEKPVNWTIGANYTLSSNLSIYARYADSYQTQGSNPQATELKLIEGGVTYAGHGFVGTVRPFYTEFNNQNFGGGVDPANANLTLDVLADSDTTGVDVDVRYRPEYAALHNFAIHVQYTYQNPALSNVRTGTVNNVGTQIATQANAFYDGKIPARTPQVLYNITPSYDFPDHKGSVYLRYKYIGQIFADVGNGVSLPGYGVVSIGGNYDITPRINFNISVDNVNNVVGLTEGNPRNGFTQTVVNGYFYGRGIVGTNALAQLTVKF